MRGKEIVSNTGQYDATLVHGYWLSQRNEESPVRMSLMTGLATRAAAALLNGGITKQLVLLGGNIWGEECPPVCRLMERALVEKYELPEERIIAMPEAFTTRGEIEQFHELFPNPPNRLLDLAFQRHFITIPGLYSRVDCNTVGFVSVEEVLISMDDIRVGNLVRRLTDSGYYFSYLIYEFTKRAVYELGGGDFLEVKAREGRSERCPCPMSSLFPMDVYRLPPRRN